MKISETENWKPIIGYEGLYEISTFGRVRFLKRTTTFKDGRKRTWPEKILNTPAAKNGYPMACLWKQGKYKFCYVHHLVLIAFVGQRPEGKQCRHFPDSTRTNNNIHNLSWGTQTENEADKLHHGTRVQAENHPHAKLTNQQVRQIRKLYSKNKYNTKELAKIYKVSSTTIVLLINKKRWKSVQ